MSYALRDKGIKIHLSNPDTSPANESDKRLEETFSHAGTVPLSGYIRIESTNLHV